ncbi:hypothetical protein JQN72_12850 [Phycicoccus sp. CSK15P-2]|uniref:hypothetical protein n=1 Tax=Phycicoccus sp. CSK15P-2 TaxID=2807627 RepID=UPI00194FB8F4|nr:hypothetical protein [Phycicoccus sp. CSK15P-2]MBM6405130.1 hypothetical protein [Phycicoccus sp. CSK15P-2]
MTAGTRTRQETGTRTSVLRRLLTSAGRHELAGHALAHPVRTVLVVYVVSRVVSLVALWMAAEWFQNPAGVGHHDPTVSDLLGLWDSVWYRRIVEDGYPVPLPRDADNGLITYSAWAFYPLFPYLVKGVMVTGLSFDAAGMLLNLVLGAVAAVLIHALFRTGYHADRQPQRERLALVAACLWCLYPTTGVMLKPYTEALAVALVATALLMLVRRHYVLVALVAVPLGFTRGVAPALGVAVVIHLVARWREERGDPVGPLAGQRVSAVVMLGALGLSAVAWPAVAGIATGVPTAFFDVQAAWGQRPALGPYVLWLEWAWDAHGLFGVLVLVGLVATYVALVLGRHGRWLSLEMRAWALAYPLYMFAVTRPITSMWRFLLLDVPLAALVASVAMRTANGQRVVPHWRRRVGVVVLLLVAGIGWWTVTLLTYTPWGSFPP